MLYQYRRESSDISAETKTIFPLEKEWSYLKENNVAVVASGTEISVTCSAYSLNVYCDIMTDEPIDCTEYNILEIIVSELGHLRDGLEIGFGLVKPSAVGQPNFKASYFVNSAGKAYCNISNLIGNHYLIIYSKGAQFSIGGIRLINISI